MRVIYRNIVTALEAEQTDLNAQLSDPEIFKDYDKAGSLQARAEEIETLLLEKLERWEMLEGKQNGGDLRFQGVGWKHLICTLHLLSPCPLPHRHHRTQPDK